MADLVDIASEQQLLIEEAQIQRLRTSTTSVPTGTCLNCDEPLQPGHSFCDQDCRTDHEKRKRMKGYAD